MNPSKSIFRVHATKSIALLGMILSVLALSGPKARGEEESLPAAEVIIDRYIQALGGKALFEKIENRVSQGYMEVPSIGLKGSFTNYEAKPDQTFSIMEIPGLGKEKRGTNENVVWSYTSMRGYKLTQGDKKKRNQRFSGQ